MLLTPTLLAICSLACTYLAAAHPLHPEMDHWSSVRERRSPMAARTMILVRGQPTNVGYHYERPERAFNPRAAMAAYATGGTVAAGSFYGARAPSQKQRCGDCHEQPAPPRPEEDTKAVEPPPEEAPEEVQEKEVAADRNPKATKPSKAPSKPRPTKEEPEEEEDDDEDGSVYRNFFPMTFLGGGGGSGGRLRSGDADGEGGRGPVTAIANSFSQGRGAVASSSAVAHGRPDPDAPQRTQHRGAGGHQPTLHSQQSRYRARA